MSVFVTTGSMVEGAKCEIYTRKENLKGMYKDPITSKNMLKYELSRNCSVEVTEELQLTTDEDIALRDRSGVHRSLHDKLKADSVTLFIDQKLPLKVIPKEGATHTHGGRFMSTNKRTVGVIKYAFSNLPQQLRAMEPIKQIKQ